jgi:crotonobetainyl-CoA:carnitine CoA-transferase CaiB-like acyl-CoA transferase
VASPAQFDEEAPTLGRAPTLGGDTDEILAAQGYEPAQIEDLRARGIIK